jgi:TPR repeat protein
MFSSQAAWLYNRSLDYLRGDDVSKNPEKAFALNAQAAESGHHDAVLSMGWFYLNGIGVAPDKTAAWHWYRKSARQGEPKAMYSLGYMAYMNRDYSDALRWFNRAVKAKHVRSLYWLGKLYWRGHGVDQDRKQALAFFEDAARAKVSEARRVLRFLNRCHA